MKWINKWFIEELYFFFLRVRKNKNCEVESARDFKHSPKKKDLSTFVTVHEWNLIVQMLWWLNFMCQLDWATSVWTFGQTLFWVCLYRCFWRRWIFEMGDSVKPMVLPSVGGSQPISWRPEEDKDADPPVSMRKFLLPGGLGLGHGFSWPSGFQTWTRTILPALPYLHLANCKS